MEIICESCKAKLNIPDDKVPQGQRITITCPRCKKRNTFDSGSKKPDSDHASNSTGDMVTPEFYEEGIKLAMVAEHDSEQKERIIQTLEDMGYKCVVPESTGQAISKMRFNKFDFLLLSDQFDGIELAQNPIRQYLNHLSMSIRRKMFVALVGDKFNTMDQMMAFVMSANVVINRNDMDKLEGILKNSMSDNENFYKVFMATLEEVGKA